MSGAKLFWRPYLIKNWILMEQRKRSGCFFLCFAGVFSTCRNVSSIAFLHVKKLKSENARENVSRLRINFFGFDTVRRKKENLTCWFCMKRRKRLQAPFRRPIHHVRVECQLHLLGQIRFLAHHQSSHASCLISILEMVHLTGIGFGEGFDVF